MTSNTYNRSSEYDTLSLIQTGNLFESLEMKNHTEKSKKKNPTITFANIEDSFNCSSKEISSSGENHLFLQGNCLAMLKKFPANSVDCVVTSPPYWSLREYDVHSRDAKFVIGDESTPEEYVKNLVEIFSEIKRVLKDSGSFWLNLGDKYHKKNLLGLPWRVAIKMQDDGWILRNDIIWDQMKGTQSARDRMRDSYEHIFHFVKNNKYYFDDKSVRIIPTQKAYTRNGEIVSATGVTGLKYRKQINESKLLTPKEKLSALNALDETLERMRTGELVDFRMTIKGYQRTYHGDKEKISGRAKDLAKNGFYIISMKSSGFMPSDIWRLVPEDKWRKDAHYAVFPEELLRIPIQSTCPDGGVVLDPFCGTGSTVAAAMKLKRNGIGIDLSKHYLNICKKRIKELLGR